MSLPSPVVTDLYVYPVKSIAGILVPKAEVTPQGLRHDRRFMLVLPDGRFITQRQYPRMALIRSEFLDSNTARFSAPDGDSIELSLEAVDGPPMEVTVWNDTVLASLAGQAYSDWFSAALQLDCRLVAMGDQYRPLKPGRGQPGDSVSFADGAPILVTTSASLQDLNRRLTEPVGMNRFRPNIVLATDVPYVEDTWISMALPNCELDVAWPCSRCVLTTVDPETGIRSGQREPLATLKRYRNAPDGPLFGQNVVPRRLGTISVGDAVEATKAQETP